MKIILAKHMSANERTVLRCADQREARMTCMGHHTLVNAVTLKWARVSLGSEVCDKPRRTLSATTIKSVSTDEYLTNTASH